MDRRWSDIALATCTTVPRKRWQTSMQEMLTHTRTQTVPRDHTSDLKSLWQLFFSSNQLHSKEIKHTQKKDEREQRDGGRKAEKIFLLGSFFWQNTTERMNEKTMFLVIFKLMLLPKYIYTHTHTHHLFLSGFSFQEPWERKMTVKNFWHVHLNRGSEMTCSFLTYVLLLWLEI